MDSYPSGSKKDTLTQKDGKTYLLIAGEEPRYYVPTTEYKRGGQDKVTGDYIKSYGTSYKWAVQEASAMLGRASDITSIENNRGGGVHDFFMEQYWLA